MTARQIYDIIDAVAPFETQSEFDNSGFLVGSPSREVSGVLFALDVTESVIDEALAVGANLIVTHHPLMFSPRKSITDEDYEGRLVSRMLENGISMIAAHTNLDQAPGGINDTLAALCCLADVSGEGFFRCGFLPEPMPAAELAAFLSDSLQATVRLMGPEDALVRKLGLCSGGGSDEWVQAADAGCDAFLSGEIKHHRALAMADRGIVAFECGHYATETPGLFALAEALQNALNEIECTIRVFKSAVPAYCFPLQP
ncbi:MAG: Nif3-like dinuclear metal center hexameric protein [Clostridia bacterium]|nr:Nif3-like dinuclear metal center hexameric protein [Clostridia bacterium]